MDIANKFFQPLYDRAEERESVQLMTTDEKINYMKNKYNLHHGKGKRKHKKK